MNKSAPNPTTVQVPVSGMHCAACSSRIERVIGRMPGVTDIAVNLADESMRVSFDQGQVDLDAIAEKVAGLGFKLETPEPALTTVDLAIGGMHCAACSSRIERVTRRLPGMSEATINLAGETGSFTFDPGRLSRRELRKAIADLGFTTEPLGAGDDRFTTRQHQAQEELRRQRRKSSRPCVSAAPCWPCPWATCWACPCRLPAPRNRADHLRPGPARPGRAHRLAGGRFYRDGIPALLRGGPNMDSLVAVGTGAAWSTPGQPHPSSDGFGPGRPGHGPLFRIGGVLLAMISVGKYLEASANSRPRTHCRTHAPGPDTATLMADDGTETTIAAAEVEPGTNSSCARANACRGRRGQPGRVARGRVHAHGRAHARGQTAWGCRHRRHPQHHRALVMVASRVGEDTTLARIVTLVRQARVPRRPSPTWPIP
jgi:Cu+-exporting ATPase